MARERTRVAKATLLHRGAKNKITAPDFRKETKNQRENRRSWGLGRGRVRNFGTSVEMTRGTTRHEYSAHFQFNNVAR